MPGRDSGTVSCRIDGCTVAVAAQGRWTYVYGDLDAEASAATILEGLGLYADTPDGVVPWRARPEAFRKGVVARIPPSLPPLSPPPLPPRKPTE